MKAKNIDTTLEKESSLIRKILFVIFVFTLLLYSNSIKNNYALDDNYVTLPKGDVGNTRVAKGIKGIPEIFKTHYVESAEQSFEYRPVPLATFAMEYQFFGSNPHVSHFISILLYAFTCMLLFTILARLFKNYNLIFPLLITFLFIIHPIHTEVVDNIKCRDELLSFFFGLCAMHFFIKSMETENKKWQFMALTILFLLVGLLCKQTIILFIVLIPITTYFFYEYKLKNFLFIALSFFIVFIAYKVFKRSMIHELKTIREFVFFENPLYYEHGFLSRIPFSLHTLGCYLMLLVFPYPLSCYYGYNTIPVADWTSPLIYIALVFFAIIGIYALIKLPKKKILSFAIIVFLLGILPFANILKPAVGIVGERFAYFASFGFCIMMAYALLNFFKIDITDKSKFKIQDSKPSFRLALIAVLLIYSCLVISRNTDWKDKLTLYNTDVAHNENSYFLHNVTGKTLYSQLTNLPAGYKKDELIKEAKTHFKDAAQLLTTGLIKYDTDYFTMTTLGVIYSNYLNNADTAFSWFKKSLAINPEYDMAQFNIGLYYEKKNLPDSAIFLYEKMVSANTKYPSVYLNLHELYVKNKDYAKAISSDEKSIKLCPAQYSVKGYVNLGNAFMLNKDTLNAIKSFEKAVKLEPNFTDLKAQVDAFKKSTGYDKKAQ